MGKKLTKEIFIERAELKHSKIYDYSLVNYINVDVKVKIICPVHNIFELTPYHHMKGVRCAKCVFTATANGKKYTKKEFIQKANNLHESKYDYSLVEYKNNKDKVSIICPKHGLFKQSPDRHFNRKDGCPKCAYELKADKHRSNTNDFIIKSNKIHDNLFDYSLVNYKSAINKVKIICKEHGIFEQQPSAHLSGQGCPTCNLFVCENRLLNTIRNEFQNINIISQGKPKWLGKQRFDIYLPDYNIAIEYQGIQHFKPVDYFGGKKSFKYTQECDKRKYDLSIENNCKLFHFTYNIKHVPDIYKYKVFHNELELIKEIKKEILCNR